MLPALQEHHGLRCGINTICSLLFTVPITAPQGDMSPTPKFTGRAGEVSTNFIRL